MTDASAGRVPPCDLDAEASVLSACLLKPDALDVVAPLVAPSDFFSDANGTIYDAISALARACGKVDTTTVAAHLSAMGKLRAIGGVAYLMQIVDATPAVHHVEAHAQIVRRLAKLRRCIAEAQTIAAEGYSAAGDVQGYLDNAAARVAIVAAPDTVGSMVTMREAVGETFAKMGSVGASRRGVAGAWPSLDRLTAGNQPGEMRIIAARPGMGKTAAMLTDAIEVAGHRGRRANGEEWLDQCAIVFSLEMSREALVQRALATEAQVDGNSIRQGTVTGDEWSRLTAAAEYLSALPLFIDDAAKPSPIEIRAKVRRIQAEQAQHGRRVGGVYIDYAQLVDGRPLVPKNASREQEVAAVSGATVRMAKELGVPTTLLAQLKRPVQSTAVVPKAPSLEDLRESGSLEQDAHAVLFIHREEYYLRDKTPEEKRNVAEFILAKQRNGPTGVVRLRFDGRYTLFSEWS